MINKNAGDSSALNFIVMGDWGGQDDSPYTTKGELLTAKAMADAATQHDARFVVALGEIDRTL